MSTDPQSTPVPRHSPYLAVLLNLVPFAAVPLLLLAPTPAEPWWFPLLYIPLTWGWGYIYLRRVRMYLAAVAVALVLCVFAVFAAFTMFGLVLAQGLSDVQSNSPTEAPLLLLLLIGLLSPAIWSLATAVHAWRLARQNNPS